VLSKDRSAIGVDFTEGDGFKSSGALKPKAEASDAREQVKNLEFSHVFSKRD
jgi:hypothetical protein